jgi:hypothetical protein
VCTSLCVLAELSPRSLGCSFFARTMDNYYAVDADSVIVGNTHASLPASVQLYVHKNGAEQPVGARGARRAGEVHEFQLTEPEIDGASELRQRTAPTGSPATSRSSPTSTPRAGAQLTNDASMLLPEPALARNYVIASAREGTLHKNHRSYFVVIADHRRHHRHLDPAGRHDRRRRRAPPSRPARPARSPSIAWRPCRSPPPSPST